MRSQFGNRADSPISLVLFLTHGSSLGSWKDAGILERELAIYQEHANNGVQFHLISHGIAGEEQIASVYPFVNVHYNRHGLHPRVYTLALPLLHHRILRAADIYKTNQAYGAHIANRCARLWRKPWLLRQGYGHFENREREFGPGTPGAIRALRYERQNMRRAHLNIVTSAGLAKRSVERHSLEPSRVRVIPNYVITKNWLPSLQLGTRQVRENFVFVGRLSAEKNLKALIEALQGLPATLAVIGAGAEREVLVKLAQRLKVNCTFYGQLAQTEVRAVLAKADVFVLPSLYEGHPKALIEAMTFGIPVLGADVDGIRDVVEDGETGLLASPDVPGLRMGIRRYLEMDQATYVQLATAAKAWATSEFSVERVALKERELLYEVLGSG